MKLSDLQNLSLDNVGTWPLPIKAFTMLLLFALLVGGGYYEFTMPQLEELDKAQKQEADKLSDLDTKQQKAANLEALRLQLDDIRKIMDEMKQKLPSKTQIPDLLQSVSQAGLGAGLEFEIFKPGAEKPVEFYVELPIDIRVNGQYHEFGKFISQVANLERIVTAHDIKIKSSGKGDKLVMEATAKTYRYLDEKEEQEAAAKNVKAKPAKKK
ncbi:MAG TPA: type 4a pilus biogenesis protein PilO [Gammaproteobacteria bacterium]|nr:type 4a pilus biogenesis protein PilO [Gammaproteobacteria bacterium]